MKKLLVIGLLAFATLVPLTTFAVWTPGDPIVPQCFQGAPYCQLCDLITLANNLITFAIYFVTLVATVLFVYAGILYVTASSGENKIEKAKGIFWKVFWGLVITLSAWLVINVVLSVLTDRGLTGWTRDTSVCKEYSNVNSGNPPPRSSNPQNETLEDTNRDLLKYCGVGVNAEAPQTILAGVDVRTLGGVCNDAKNCRVVTGKVCGLVVTGGSESGHAGSGDGSHSGGDKVDLRANGPTKEYVQKQVASGAFERIDNPSFGVEQYRDTKTGAIWTFERTTDSGGRTIEHYDVCYQNCSSGGD